MYNSVVDYVRDGLKKRDAQGRPVLHLNPRYLASKITVNGRASTLLIYDSNITKCLHVKNEFHDYVTNLISDIPYA